MRIQNNITAMNTHRQYTINNDNVAKSAEKLSSGYRINRAGDDAAGLAISEKMRSQIRGLNMATKNSQDAISLVQTAEGALQETHSMLQRMNELAVQAATGTNQESDRMALAKEFEQLKKEINDVAEQTTFNNMKILDGSLSYKGYERSAATAGVTVTRPTQLEGASTAAKPGEALGAVVTGLDISKDASVSIDGGKSVTITAKYTDTEGKEQTLEFTAKNTQNGGTGETIANLFAGTNSEISKPEGWAIEVTNGQVKLTATEPVKMDSSTQVELSISTNDTAAADKLETKPVESAKVELAQTKDAQGAKITLNTADVQFAASNTPDAIQFKVKIGDEDVTVSVGKGTVSNTGINNKKLSEIGANGDNGNLAITVSGSTKWDAAVDTSGNLVLTAKEGPKDASEVLDAKAVGTVAVTDDKNSVGTVAVASVDGGAEAKSTGAATAAKSTDASVGATAAAANVAAGEKGIITLNINGKDVTFTSESKSTTPDSWATLFKNETLSDDGEWKLSMGSDGKLTVEATKAGEISDLKDPAIKVVKMEDTNGTATTPTAGEVVEGKLVNGTNAKPTAASSSSVTTVEYDFAKLQDGDTVEVDIAGTTVSVTKDAVDTRDSFIKKLESAVSGIAGVKVSGTAIVAEDGVQVGDPTLAVDSLADTKTNAIRIQVGALENEQLNVAIDSMNTKGLGLDGITLDSQDKAGAAITAVRNAVLKVADQRATLGAMQNRLDHKIANLKVTSENLSAAESRIRDVDMASEMTNFTKNNILSQAATAMLAQANALPQNVLSLLG